MKAPTVAKYPWNGSCRRNNTAQVRDKIQLYRICREKKCTLCDKTEPTVHLRERYILYNAEHQNDFQERLVTYHPPSPNVLVRGPEGKAKVTTR
ncbi:hypothetical protein J6590_033211 [Homalodisca vitripennis]|nr:hypothetical protein J6590_033211 [Homalodisca vitripennis]